MQQPCGGAAIQRIICPDVAKRRKPLNGGIEYDDGESAVRKALEPLTHERSVCRHDGQPVDAGFHQLVNEGNLLFCGIVCIIAQHDLDAIASQFQLSGPDPLMYIVPGAGLIIIWQDDSETDT